MIKVSISIIQELEAQIKGQIIEEVLLELPEWFGLPEATREYIDNGQNYLLWVIKDMTETIGFISLKETSPFVAEIYCMGIKKDYHQQGYGTLLFNTFKEHCIGNYQFLQVKTVANGHYEIYDKTIKFYKAMGFVELEIFPTLWDKWNPCLLLIQSLD